MPLEILLNYIFGIIGLLSFGWLAIVMKNEELTESEKNRKVIAPAILLVLAFIGAVRSWKLALWIDSL